MMVENLINSLPEHYSAVDRELILRAYQFAEAAHQGQKRASGEPYITHCVAVAAILAELEVPPTIIAAGLLHDTVEDTKVTLEDVRKEFGDEITRLVDGVTKLTHLPRVSRGDQHYSEIEEYGLDEEEPTETNDDVRRKLLAQETLRKTFLAMGEDMRVVLIKLADRLHNMRTLRHMPEHKASASPTKPWRFLRPWPTAWASGR